LENASVNANNRTAGIYYVPFPFPQTPSHACKAKFPQVTNLDNRQGNIECLCDRETTRIRKTWWVKDKKEMDFIHKGVS
jgi:hypothetical protein